MSQAGLISEAGANMTPYEVSETAKSQAVRILDVIAIGPLMTWGGYTLRKQNPVAGAMLAFFGVSTILYNARNYYRVASSGLGNQESNLDRRIQNP